MLLDVMLLEFTLLAFAACPIGAATLPARAAQPAWPRALGAREVIARAERFNPNRDMVCDARVKLAAGRRAAPGEGPGAVPLIPGIAGGYPFLRVAPQRRQA